MRTPLFSMLAVVLLVSHPPPGETAGRSYESDSALLEQSLNTVLLEQAQQNPVSAFLAWAGRFGKVYASLEDRQRRFVVWLDNLEYILQYNLHHDSHWLGLNYYADQTLEEFSRGAVGVNATAAEAFWQQRRQLAENSHDSFRYANVSAQQSVDWRTQGVVTHVKNQAQCGSCWAFSAVGAIESANALAGNSLVSLSEQELVDCDRTTDNGCHGGLMNYAFQFVLENGGVTSEADYPYKGVEGTCSMQKLAHKVVTIDGYEVVPANNERALMKAVSYQPVSIAIAALDRSFQLYQGGVYSDESCSTVVNHGVLLVGYDNTAAQPFWTVKNSWGPYWGERGYIRMKMNVGPYGLCALASIPSYPLKYSDTPTPAPPGPPAPPPPPPPEPVVCDRSTTCQAGSTCCCSLSILGWCLSWGCCPLADGVCCSDGKHCCPQGLPVCDVSLGRCLAAAGNASHSVEWYNKTAAASRWPGRWPQLTLYARYGVP